MDTTFKKNQNQNNIKIMILNNNLLDQKSIIGRGTSQYEK
jgi:hypothetical protein